MTVNAADGTFTTSTTVNGRGSCSLADLVGTGATISVNGDTLTLDVSGQVSTFSRLKGDFNPLVGSWLIGEITEPGDGGHTLLTFFDDATYMLSEDCSGEFTAGTEYGTYAWDEGNTNQLTNTITFDFNGTNPGCGLSENTNDDWGFVVTGDTMTLTVPAEGNVPNDFTRHSPALAPIIPPIAFDNGVLPGTSRYDVYFDDETLGWVIEELAFGANGSDFTLIELDNLGNPGISEPGSYAVINGVLQIPGDYLMIMSLDVTSGAHRVCWQGTYAGLNACDNPGDEFLFNNLSNALAFLNARITGATFSGFAVNASTVFAASGLFMLEVDSYYDGELDEEVDELLFFELTADGTGTPGTSATDEEYLFIDGSWVLSTDTTDIALTPSGGWTSGVDWRFDTSLIVDPAVTLSNVEGSDTLNSLTATFSEMDINGEPILDYVDGELAGGLVNGAFTAGAKVYETSITVDNDYYYINNWGNDCGTDYNGNCNVAQLRTLDRITGDLTGFTVATDTSFVNDNTATIELGWNPNSMSLVAVFAPGGVLEFWEVNWSVSSIATQTVPGTWTSAVVGTETLVTYVVPVALQNSYEVQGDDSPAVFLSQQDGYMRFGEKEDEAGQMETVYFLNDAAFDDINNNIPGIPTLP
jgi:hypothetical protein